MSCNFISLPPLSLNLNLVPLLLTKERVDHQAASSEDDAMSIGHLDAGASVPAAAADGSVVASLVVVDNGVAAAGTAGNPDAKDGAGEPEDGGEEAECDVGLPAVAGALVGDVGPVEDGAALKRTDECNEEAEGDEPADGEEEVDGPVDEGAAEGEEPEESEEHGESSDGFGVDETALGPGVVAQLLVLVEPLACETSDGCSKGELADAEHH